MSKLQPELAGGEQSANPPEQKKEEPSLEAKKEKKHVFPVQEEEDEDEPVEWDGSEATLVADEEAAVYEEKQTGIKLSYTLRPDEVFHALKKSGMTKTSGLRAVVEILVLAVLAAVFFFQYFSGTGAPALFFGIVSVALAAVVAVVPYLGRRRKAIAICNNPKIASVQMEIFPDEIVMGKGEGKWEIPLDGSCFREEYKNMILLHTADRLVLLPLRAVEPAVRAEVQGMVLSGTEEIKEA